MAPVPLPAPETSIQVSTNLVVRAIPRTVASAGTATVSSESPVAEDPGGGTGGATTADNEFPEIKLQSIIVPRGEPMAMIEGQTLVAGEWFGQVQVVEIRPTSVLLRWQGRDREVRLREQL